MDAPGMTTIRKRGARPFSLSEPVRVVSLFCGCGASDFALYAAAKRAGIAVEVVAAYDSWPRAVSVYNANLPHPVAQVADLKTLAPEDLPPHDLIIGGPPCQPFSMAGKRTGHDDPRNCLPDFVRLTRNLTTPFVMENVAPRLVNAGWSEKLCAADFGDVTSRRRWFYSSHLLCVVPTPGPRRIRDIRDHDEDARVLAKRCGCKAGAHAHYDSLDYLCALCAHSWHGHDIRNGKLVAIVERTGDLAPNDSRVLCNDAMLATATAKPSVNLNAGALKIGLRGHSASASASAFEDGSVLGSVIANSWHGNEQSRLVACRNPSLLEMQRAHSFPESWDWAGATKTDRGKMIANSWTISMGTAVLEAALRAIGAKAAA
jgi:site-specific DNA-cytosine methylase